MTTADRRPTSLPSPMSRAVLAGLAVLLACAVFAPQADAAKRQNVVAISPFAAATMVKLGVKPRAVGQTLGGDRRKPKALNGVPILTLSHPNGPNLERMAKMRPKIVFTSSRWSKGTKPMRRLGIRVVNADPTTIGGVFKSVTRMGRLLKRKRQANKLKRRIRQKIKFATGRRFKSRPKVMLILGVGRTPFTFLPNSWGGQIIRRAGGVLATGGVSGKGGFAKISDELVVKENPDVILAVPHGSVTDIDQVKDYILNNEAWKTTNAFKTGRVDVSVDNELLQAGTDVGQIIQKVRRKWMRNW